MFSHGAGGAGRSDDSLRLLGAFASAEEALREIPGLQPTLAVMDINLPKMNGIECGPVHSAPHPAAVDE